MVKGNQTSQMDRGLSAEAYEATRSDGRGSEGLDAMEFPSLVSTEFSRTSLRTITLAMLVVGGRQTLYHGAPVVETFTFY